MINNMALTTICAFLGSMITTVVILLLARIKKLSSQAIILAGIALSSLFVSGTILIQYFANEVELASIVFWTFGDVARSNWKEIGITAICVIPVTAYFFLKRWELNALDSGDDSAKSLGVHVERVRLIGMVLTALVASFVTAFHGVIAFLGLLAPHIAKRLVSSNHVLLIPMSCMIGAMLLLVADTVGRSYYRIRHFACWHSHIIYGCASLSVPAHKREKNMILNVTGLGFSYNGRRLLDGIGFLCIGRNARCSGNKRGREDNPSQVSLRNFDARQRKYTARGKRDFR